MALSDGLRMELMLELSGLSWQEVLVVKACATTKDFEGVAKVLTSTQESIWGRDQRTFTPQSYGKSGKGYGGSKGSQSGNGSFKTAYNAYPDEEGYGEYEEYQEEYYEEDAPYVGLLGGIEEHIAEQHASHADNPPEASVRMLRCQFRGLTWSPFLTVTSILGHTWGTLWCCRVIRVLNAKVPFPKRKPKIEAKITFPKRKPKIGVKITLPKRKPKIGAKITFPKRKPKIGAKITVPKRKPKIGSKMRFPKQKPKIGAKITFPKWKPKSGAETLPKWKPKSGAEKTPQMEAQKWSRKNLPIPPQPSRFMICTDDDMFRGNPKEQTPKTESTDCNTSSSDESRMAKPVKADLSNDDSKHAETPLKGMIIKEETRDLLPVGLTARDPDGSNPFEIVLDSDPDVEVHEHGPIAIHPNERVTMGRTHRKAVLDGISNLNKHDTMIQSGLGLISNPSHDSKTVVFTSHPFVFLQESGQPLIDVIDVGVGASDLDPEFDPKDFCNLLDGYQNIVSLPLGTIALMIH